MPPNTDSKAKARGQLSGPPEQLKLEANKVASPAQPIPEADRAGSLTTSKPENQEKTKRVQNDSRVGGSNLTSNLSLYVLPMLYGFPPGTR